MSQLSRCLWLKTACFTGTCSALALSISRSSIRNSLFLTALSLSLSACDQSNALASNKKTTSSVESTEKTMVSNSSLFIAQEDLITLSNQTLSSGPFITGSIQAERQADLRAEVAAVVLSVLKDNGDEVNRGELLIRLDDTAIHDALSSAQASTRAAEQGYAQAKRQLKRLIQLRESGQVSLQSVEDGEIMLNNAQSDWEAAKSRTAQAQQQLQRTKVIAPFDGVVSDRKVSAGDTVQIGKELVKVIDPSSMRFEGLVSANNIGEVSAGQTVALHIQGYADKRFIGQVARLNPVANITTRQVEVLVNFSGTTEHPKISGLYAEGRIETSSTEELTIPASALVQDEQQSFAWRINDNRLYKISLALGERNNRSGDFTVTGGLSAGDKLLRYPLPTLKDGQIIELVGAVNPAVKTQ